MSVMPITASPGRPPARTFEPVIPPGQFIAEMSVADVGFRFDLWGRETRLGDGADALEIDQVWMDTRTLYPQRNRSAPNFGPVTDYFWARCQAAAEVAPAQQDIYLLAKLLPHARANGSRRVLPDAVPSRAAKHGVGGGGNRTDDDVAMADIFEAAVSAAAWRPGFGLGSVEFRDRTADALGCPRYHEMPALRAAYEQFTGGWLARGRAALANHDQPGLCAFLAEWENAMNNWGRHRGHELGKAVLDVLSYECRAAFHRCYTVVWQDLLYHLGTKGRLDGPGMRFIQLWHLDRSSPTDDPAVDFHLFHGHVLGLHPASGLLMRAPTGRYSTRRPPPVP